MKHTFFRALFICIALSPIFSQTSSTQPVSNHSRCPALLAGLWKGSDRYIYFDGGENAVDTSFPLSIVLKEYYGWYYDRAAEPASVSGTNPREKNAAQSSSAEQISVTYENLLNADYETCGAWDLIVKYPGEKENVHIPVAVIGDRLYLDFAIHDSDEDFYGFYKRTGNVSGITISVPKKEKELDCLYFVAGDAETVLEEAKIITGSRKQLPYVPVSNRMLSFYGTTAEGDDDENNNNTENLNGIDTEKQSVGEKQPVAAVFAYHLRYWKTDMEYQPDALVSFTPASKQTYSIHKHLVAGDELYTSATGRRKEVRNMNKAEPDVIVDYELGETESGRVLLAAFGKPYLIRDEGELFKLIEEANKRQKPPAKPLFEQSNLDYRIDIIDIIEQYNPTVQEFKQKGGRSYLK